MYPKLVRLRQLPVLESAEAMVPRGSSSLYTPELQWERRILSMAEERSGKSAWMLWGIVLECCPVACLMGNPCRDDPLGGIDCTERVLLRNPVSNNA